MGMKKKAGNSDQELRSNRLIFYADDVAEIDTCLKDFLERSKANCVLLIDIEGHMVTKQGFTNTLDTTTIAALVAGSFASTRALAEKLGEKEFSVLFHQGENENIHIALVANRCLVVIIFDDRTTIGMVRLYAKEVAEALTKLLGAIDGKERPDQENPMAAEGFTEEAEAKLDEFFGGD